MQVHIWDIVSVYFCMLAIKVLRVLTSVLLVRASLVLIAVFSPKGKRGAKRPLFCNPPFFILPALLSSLLNFKYARACARQHVRQIERLWPSCPASFVSLQLALPLASSHLRKKVIQSQKQKAVAVPVVGIAEQVTYVPLRSSLRRCGMNL